jgi:chromosome segregation ATPase
MFSSFKEAAEKLADQGAAALVQGAAAAREKANAAGLVGGGDGDGDGDGGMSKGAKSALSDLSREELEDYVKLQNSKIKILEQHRREAAEAGGAAAPGASAAEQGGAAGGGGEAAEEALRAKNKQLMSKLQEVVGKYKLMQARLKAAESGAGAGAGSAGADGDAASSVIAQLEADKEKMAAKLQEVVGRYAAVQKQLQEKQHAAGADGAAGSGGAGGGANADGRVAGLEAKLREVVGRYQKLQQQAKALKAKHDAMVAEAEKGAASGTAVAGEESTAAADAPSGGDSDAEQKKIAALSAKLQDVLARYKKLGLQAQAIKAKYEEEAANAQAATKRVAELEAVAATAATDGAGGDTAAEEAATARVSELEAQLQSKQDEHAAALAAAAESAGGEVSAAVQAAVAAKQSEHDAALAELTGKLEEATSSHAGRVSELEAQLQSKQDEHVAALAGMEQTHVAALVATSEAASVDTTKQGESEQQVVALNAKLKDVIARYKKLGEQAKTIKSRYEETAATAVASAKRVTDLEKELQSNASANRAANGSFSSAAARLGKLLDDEHAQWVEWTATTELAN